MNLTRAVQSRRYGQGQAHSVCQCMQIRHSFTVLINLYFSPLFYDKQVVKMLYFK